VPNASAKRDVRSIHDPVARHWSIYWADRSPGTVLVPPVVASFQDGRGEVFSDRMIDGKSIRMSFTRISAAPAP
jgi:hypothetical protein